MKKIMRSGVMTAGGIMSGVIIVDDISYLFFGGTRVWFGSTGLEF